MRGEIDDELIGLFGAQLIVYAETFHAYCKECKNETSLAAVPAGTKISDKKRAKSAKKLLRQGWRFDSHPTCPECVYKLEHPTS